MNPAGKVYKTIDSSKDKPSKYAKATLKLIKGHVFIHRARLSNNIGSKSLNQSNNVIWYRIVTNQPLPGIGKGPAPVLLGQ